MQCLLAYSVIRYQTEHMEPTYSSGRRAESAHLDNGASLVLMLTHLVVLFDGRRVVEYTI